MDISTTASRIALCRAHSQHAPAGLSLQETGGTYSIALSDMDIEERIREHAPPPPHRATDGGDSLVGFAEGLNTLFSPSQAVEIVPR